MKHNLLALSIGAALAFASPAFSGGMAEPIMTMEPDIVMEEAAGTSGDLLVPLILIALIAAALSGGGGEVFEADSDVRMKTDIVRVGTATNGLPLYHFRYIGSSPVFEGVMAQDVLMHTPEAVIIRPNGSMAVNYAMLGINMKIIQ